MDIERADDGFVVDADVLAALLDVAARDIPKLMRDGKINCVCEVGVDDHEGEHRLSFFYGNRRARLRVDDSGQIIQRSAVDFGSGESRRLGKAR